MSKIGNHYLTRALRANDRRYAMILGKLGHTPRPEPKAKPKPKAKTAKPEAEAEADDAAAAAEAAAAEEIAAVRAEYTEKLGKKPFMGWDVATLREKIDAAEAPSE